MDYPSEAWRAFLGWGTSDLPLAALIAHAVQESALNRRAASDAGDATAALAFANRLVKLGFAQARQVSAGDRADLADLIADIEAHANLYDPLGKVAGIFTSLAVLIVVAILGLLFFRWKGARP
jgi:hypothetical protein